ATMMVQTILYCLSTRRSGSTGVDHVIVVTRVTLVSFASPRHKNDGAASGAWSVGGAEAHPAPLGVADLHVAQGRGRDQHGGAVLVLELGQGGAGGDGLRHHGADLGGGLLGLEGQLAGDVADSDADL